MACQGWKGFAVAGVLGALGLTAGCNDRQEAKVRDEARQVGKEVGKAVEDVREAGSEAAEGLREGYGGAGKEGDPADRKREGVDIGRNPGVINDGEGPLEERQPR